MDPKLKEDLVFKTHEDRLTSELSLSDILANVPDEDVITLVKSIAEQIGTIETEIVMEEPDVTQMLRIDPAEIEEILLSYKENQMNNKKTADVDSYMPTDDPTGVVPGSDKGDTSVDNAELVRFQTSASVKGKILADGVDSSGDVFQLVEITEQAATRGEYVRWEVRGDAGKVIHEGGPLFLDDPRYSDAALADVRLQMISIFKTLTAGNMRLARSNQMDLNKKAESKKLPPVCDFCHRSGILEWDSSGDKATCQGCMYEGKSKRKEAAIEVEKQKRISALREQVTGLRLTASQKQVISDIESDIMAYNSEFINTVGGIMKQDFDPGSSWELQTEADGKSKLVRIELKDDGVEMLGKHAFAPGTPVILHSDILPEDAIVLECLGDSNYKIQSKFTGKVSIVAEADIYSPDETGEDDLFGDDYPVNVGTLANL